MIVDNNIKGHIKNVLGNKDGPKFNDRGRGYQGIYDPEYKQNRPNSADDRRFT